MRLKTRESGLLYQLSKITKSKLNTLVRKSVARQRRRPRTRKSIDVVIRENRKYLAPIIFGYGYGRLQLWRFSFTKYGFRQCKRKSYFLAALP